MKDKRCGKQCPLCPYIKEGNQTRALRVSTPVNGYTIAEPSLWAPTVIELGPKGLKKLQFSKKNNCSFAEMSRKKKMKFQIYCTMFYFQKKSFKILQFQTYPGPMCPPPLVTLSLLLRFFFWCGFP